MYAEGEARENEVEGEKESEDVGAKADARGVAVYITYGSSSSVSSMVSGRPAYPEEL